MEKKEQTTTGTDWLEAYQRATEQRNTSGNLPQWPTQQTCPSCGYCPHCGRGGYHSRPWRDYPYVVYY